jgi:hypothetical protein
VVANFEVALSLVHKAKEILDEGRHTFLSVFTYSRRLAYTYPGYLTMYVLVAHVSLRMKEIRLTEFKFIFRSRST